MALETNKLTTVQLQHWMRSKKPVAKADGGGLTFTLSKAGTASWVLRYRFGGRPRELTLGNYPALSISAARQLARKHRVAIQSGGDPAADNRKQKSIARKDWTVRRLIEDYRAKVLPGLGSSTQRSYGRNLKRIESRLGALTVRAVEPTDIIGMIEDARLGWVEANTLLVTAKVVFRHAAGRKLVAINPAKGIELSAILGPRPAIRERLMLTEEEIRILFAGPMSRVNALSVRILLATAVRSAELFTAQWEHVDLKSGVWNIPASKAGRAMDIPLAPPVIEWVKELQGFSFGSRYVLPAREEGRRERNGGDTHINRNTLPLAVAWWQEHHAEDIRRFTPHDLRSTAKSWLRKLGVPRDITEMCLNHKLPGVEGEYDQYGYFDERKEALTRWAAFQVACVAGENVKPLRRGKAA
jgi:integrase